MRIAVQHTTRYTYAAPATYSIQSLRLTPRRFDGQEIVSWAIEAAGIEHAGRFCDAFGNEGHLVSHAEPHDGFVVTARGVVETSDRHGIVTGLPESVPLRVCLRQTTYTRPDDAIGALAAAARGNDQIERLHDLMQRIRDAIEYETAATESSTTAAEALAAGCGVCQDHAHVFISAARALNVPARYVTGYLVTSGDVPARAQHAWAEAFVDDLGWVGFDVANRICPNDLYVRLGAGLDAGHAAPIRGSRRGGGAETLDVDVAVGQQQQ